MRFVMLMMPGAYTAAGAPSMPDEAMVEAMMKFNDDLATAGSLISLDGFYPPEQGVRISFEADGAVVAPIGFDEGRPLGGYWVIDVASELEAIDWASRCPAMKGDIIEVRRVQQMEDFPQELQDLAAPLAAKLANDDE